MHLEGSCHCGAVRFSLESAEPVPYQRCYCSICRKTQGGGAYAVNLGGDAATLRVTGGDAVGVYRARLTPLDDPAPRTSSGERNFCTRCGSALWLFDPHWPALIQPFASAIDTPLPVPPERTHLMLASAAPWAEPDVRPGDQRFDGYPEESLAAWHARTGLAAR